MTKFAFFIIGLVDRLFIGGLDGLYERNPKLAEFIIDILNFIFPAK